MLVGYWLAAGLSSEPHLAGEAVGVGVGRQHDAVDAGNENGGEPIEERAAMLEDGSKLVGATIAAPRMRSDIWGGETEASITRRDVLDEADSTGFAMADGGRRGSDRCCLDRVGSSPGLEAGDGHV